MAEEFIGLDIGGKHVGVARGNSVARIAEPLATWPADKALSELGNLLTSQDIAAVVVGLPRGMSGQDTDQTKAVRQWVSSAKQAVQIPIFWQDEALTSIEASQHAGHTHDDHAHAAAIILQDFLNAADSDRMVA